MAFTTHIIRKALQNAGIWVSEAEEVPGDYLVPCMGMLQDILAELNAQSAIVFEQTITETTLVGSSLTFKPYTDAERLIIDGGGTVDLTDRLTDFIPVQAPSGVTVNGNPLRMVSISDLALMDSTTAISAYAFQVSSDSSKMLFDGSGGILKFVRNKPITMDDDITGEVHVPTAYDHFLVTKLAEAASLRYQFSESASLFAQKGKAQGNALANNVVSNRPIPHKTIKNLNRFR
jgi:hypothetical protein